MTKRIRQQMLGVIMALLAGTHAGAGETNRFAGFKALVVEPENSWGWDSAIFGALEERGFEASYGRLSDHTASLPQYDLVALSIRRGLAPAEAQALKAYVAQGGAVYGSWGGPFATPAFLQEVCRVGRFSSVRISQLTLLPGPLRQGIGEAKLLFADRVGHLAANTSEVVALEPLAEGLSVAEDSAGHSAGVLSRYGQGRTAVLGFGPEKENYFLKPELGPIMLDNLLAWLLEGKLSRQRRAWSDLIAVALPRRTRVLAVQVDGRRLLDFKVKETGSLKRVEVAGARLGPHKEFDLCVAYEPLAAERNVQTVIHLPWNTLRPAAESPAKLAEHLKSLHTTICQPLLRGPFGEAWYKGMPEDEPDQELVGRYGGNFLADLIRECHARGIKVMAGLYLDHATPLRKYPEVKRLDREGREVKDQYGRLLACFNNPKAQEHNLATVEHLLRNYEVDGVVLDDNFELDNNDCYCQYCQAGFKEYCTAKGITCPDPAHATGELAAHWRHYRRQATRNLAAKITALARTRGVTAGGWVGVGMDATHLAPAFDWLGGMVYTEPPRAARGPLSVLGKCGFICLLWAPDASAQALDRDVREAVHAGCAAVGFWVCGEDGGYAMEAPKAEAIRGAFGGVETEWLDFYRHSILSGDRRFVLVEGKVGREKARFRLRNAGQEPGPRIQGKLDIDALR